MALKSSKGFSLIEVIVSVAVLSTAIMFVLRSFATVLTVSKIGQDMTRACLTAENELWKIEQEQRKTGSSLEAAGTDAGGVFFWNYTTEQNPAWDSLMNCTFSVTWKENRKGSTRQQKIYTLLSSP